MDFRTLGQSRSRRDEDAPPLGGRKQRALLALLLLHASQVVSRDRLIDALWGERAATEAERLAERHLVAIEERVNADLAAGRGPELVSELEALERLILRHDPELAAVKRGPRGERRTHRRAAVAVAAAAILAGRAAVGVILRFGSSTASTPPRSLNVGISRLAAVAMHSEVGRSGD